MIALSVLASASASLSAQPDRVVGLRCRGAVQAGAVQQAPFPQANGFDACLADGGFEPGLGKLLAGGGDERPVDRRREDQQAAGHQQRQAPGQAACRRGEGLRPGRRGVLHRVAGRWRAGACRRL